MRRNMKRGYAAIISTILSFALAFGCFFGVGSIRALAAVTFDLVVTYEDGKTGSAKVVVEAPATTILDEHDVAYGKLTEEHGAWYAEIKDKIDDGYEPYYANIHIRANYVEGYGEGAQYNGNLTLPIPEGYDSESFKTLQIFNGLDHDFEKRTPSSTTETTVTFPMYLKADPYVDEVDPSNSNIQLSIEIFFEVKKIETKGVDDGVTEKAADGNEYTVISNEREEAKFTKLSADAKGQVTIPETIELNKKTYKVIEVAEGALKDNVNITSVTIGKNVKKIGKEAMAGCTGLTSVDLGSPDEIGEGALSNCTQLTNVKIPETIKKISANMMAGCTGLTSVDLGNAEEIDEGALSKCKKLKKLSIPATTKTIGKNAFKDDSKLTNLTVNAKSLKTVGKNAIKNINSKAKITIKGTKKQQEAAEKLITKKSTGYKKTMKIKKKK